ncbi:MAG: tRNA-binding protein [Actinobacteria bacterium]|nr:tRNA-binding protein [Actinomycetota bacterium]
MSDPSDFFTHDIRVGSITRAEPFPQARQPAYKLWVDLGDEIGVKTSSARLTDLYGVADLVGRQVVCVVSFPARKIGPFMSEVLVLGVDTERGVVLLQPDDKVEDGQKIF